MRVVVLHSTESDPGSGRAVADYLVREGKVSHEVYDPSNDQTISLVRAGVASKALKNLAGGVETNRRDSDRDGYADVYQIEIVGRATNVPDYPEAWHRNLARHVAAVCFLTGTPLTFPCQFKSYPASYGRNGVRLSAAGWTTVTGVVGHQHVPENDHGDPGDISRTIQFIQQGADEMNQAQEAKLDRVLSLLDEGLEPGWGRLGYAVLNTNDKVSKLYDRPAVDVQALAAAVVAALPTVTASGAVDVNALARAVADELHRRMAA